MHAGRRGLREAQTQTFDVICAGVPQWKLSGHGDPSQAASAHLRPGAGAAAVALALAGEGLRVALVSNLPQDASGRRLRQRLAAAGVDVEAVTLAPPVEKLVVADARGEAGPIPSLDEQRLPFEVPAGWSSQLLLLSGLSPVVSHAAALCKAARAARRAGSFVLLDFKASLRTWVGRDPRTTRMVLREVDAVRCSLADLAVVGMDVDAVRAALRPGSILVVGDAAGGTVATGPFGQVAVVPAEATSSRPLGHGDAITTAICAELARTSKPGESAAARWHRALQRGHALRRG
jgi:sugar/nucleoside kinase (ribokinase family)